MRIESIHCRVEVNSETCCLIREFEYDMCYIDCSDIAVEDFKRIFPHQKPLSVNVVKVRRYCL